MEMSALAPAPEKEKPPKPALLPLLLLPVRACPAGRGGK
jgi:hypothetical protein